MMPSPLFDKIHSHPEKGPQDTQQGASSSYVILYREFDNFSLSRCVTCDCIDGQRKGEKAVRERGAILHGQVRFRVAHFKGHEFLSLSFPFPRSRHIAVASAPRRLIPGLEVSGGSGGAGGRGVPFIYLDRP